MCYLFVTFSWSLSDCTLKDKIGFQLPQSNIVWILDPEVILDELDPDDDGNAEEDYEGYEGYYDEEGGDESMTSDQGGQLESSQGRFQPKILSRNINAHVGIFCFLIYFDWPLLFIVIPQPFK